MESYVRAWHDAVCRRNDPEAARIWAEMIAKFGLNATVRETRKAWNS